MKTNKIISAILSAVMCVSVFMTVPASAATGTSKTTSTAKTTAKTTTKKTKEREVNIDSLVEIQPVCGRQATCQTDLSKCVVDVMYAHNPYDVVWDYGKDYDKLAAKLDWSKVFDAKYYMKEFPMLALQYNYDEKLLLEHFQTVGIHEGRQGNSKFNVQAYIENGGKSLKKYLADNYEGYYFYYMMNYASEKNVNTISIKKGTPATQLKVTLTKHQAEEFKNIDKYRDEVKAPTVYWCSEAAALANFRAYINVKDDWNAHDWNYAHLDEMCNYSKTINGTYRGYCENNLTYESNNYASLKAVVDTKYYRNSPEHYKEMVSSEFHYVGTSNLYKDINEQKNCTLKGKYTMSHMQLYYKTVA